jgi:tetratricopeptide (TPR) repeat protein
MGADSDQRDTPPVSSPAPKTASWLIPVLVAGITLVTFLPALRCGFVNWDDDRNLIANPMFRGFDADRLAWMFTTFYGGHYQPLTWLSYAVDHAVWGMRPVGYHLTNTLLHTLCAVLFYVVAIRVLTRVTDRPGPEREPLLRSGEAVVKWAAGFAALLFAVHPLRVESVVWVTERRDVLSGVFFLASLLAYMRAIDRARGSWRWHLVAWACMLLSLGAKAIGMTLPVVMLVMDVYLRGGWRAGAVRRRTILIEKIPYAMLAGTAAWVAMQAQRSAGAWRPLADFGWLERMVAAGYSAWFYLAKWVAPHGLAPLYPLPEDGALLTARYAIPAGLAGALLVAACIVRRRLPGMPAALVAYGVILAPVSGVAQSGKHLVADRYSYLALLPMALLAGGAGMWLTRRATGSGIRKSMAGGAAVGRAVGDDSRSPGPLPDGRGADGGNAGSPLGWLMLGGVIVLGLALLTWPQIHVWRDSEALWRHTLVHQPESSVARVNLGYTIWRDRQDPEAGDLFRSALARDPSDPRALNGLGMVLLAAGQAPAALDAFEKAIAVATHQTTGEAELAGYHCNRGYVLAGFGRYADAARAYDAARNLDPGNVEAWRMAGALLVEAGAPTQARDLLAEGYQLHPRDRALAGQLAWLLATHPHDAVRDGSAAKRIATDLAERTDYADPWVLKTLAAALAEAGDAQEAVRTVDVALQRAVERGAAELRRELAIQREHYVQGAAYREPDR